MQISEQKPLKTENLAESSKSKSSIVPLIP